MDKFTNTHNIHAYSVFLNVVYIASVKWKKLLRVCLERVWKYNYSKFYDLKKNMENGNIIIQDVLFFTNI